MMTLVTPETRIVRGTVQWVNGNHHPCRQTGTIWYRHDTVICDGRLLGGYIQVKERRVRFGRLNRKQVEMVTAHDGHCAMGCNVDWLIVQNQPALNQP